MKLSLIKQQILSGEFDDRFELLYSDVESSVKRYAESCDEFANIFGEQREVDLYSAPGRTEVGGNHTDHQLGCVLAGSVNLDVIAVASATDNNIVRVKSKGFDMDTVNLDTLTPIESEKEKAASLIRG